MRENKILEKYTRTLELYLKTGFELRPEEKKKIMLLLSEAYEKIGDKAEAVAWRAKAMAEQASLKAENQDKK